MKQDTLFERRYSTAEAARLTAVTVRQMQWMTETGLVAGKRGEYTYRDIERARFIRNLRERGLRTRQLRRVLSAIERSWILPSPANWVTISNGRCRIWTDADALIAYGVRIAGGIITFSIPPTL